MEKSEKFLKSNLKRSKGFQYTDPKEDQYRELPIEVEHETSTLKKSVTFADIPKALDQLENNRFKQFMKPSGSDSSNDSDQKFMMEEIEEIEFEDLEKEGLEIERQSEWIEQERQREKAEQERKEAENRDR